MSHNLTVECAEQVTCMWHMLVHADARERSATEWHFSVCLHQLVNACFNLAVLSWRESIDIKLRGGVQVNSTVASGTLCMYLL